MQTRSQTGLVPPTNVTFVRLSARTEFFVHYEGATPLTQSHSECAAKVREFQRFHMEQRGWSDIGYNFLVCQHGTVFEGRGWTAVGAHCPDHNTTGIGAQFMIGGSQEPSDAAKAAMHELYLEACRLTGKTLAKKGHRDGFATECPGAAAYAWVKAGMPAPITEENDMPLTPDDAKTLLTGAPVMKNVFAANPDIAPRVAASYLIETTAQMAKETNAAVKALAATVASLTAKPQAAVDVDALLDALAVRIANK
jgi:hypothetical protein